MQEINLYGMFIPTLALLMCASLVMNWLITKALTKAGFYRLVWHRPLFNLALFVTILGLNIILYNRYIL